MEKNERTLKSIGTKIQTCSMEAFYYQWEKLGRIKSLYQKNERCCYEINEQQWPEESAIPE